MQGIGGQENGGTFKRASQEERGGKTSDQADGESTLGNCHKCQVWMYIALLKKIYYECSWYAG